MAGLIFELQADALNSKAPVSDLLRKALVVSKKLGISDFEKWINSELNGYKDSNELPEYRHLHGEVKVWNPYHGYQPLNFSNPKHAELLSSTECWQPVSELDELSNSDTKLLYMPYSQETTNMLLESMSVGLQPSLQISKTSVIGILDAVRNNILNWALNLEQKGILGESMSFSSEEKSAASQVTYQITNNIGSMSNSQLQQHSNNSSQATTASLDTAQLLAFLCELTSSITKLPLIASDQAELQAEINTIKSQAESPKPKTSILQESFKSIRAILEGAAGNVLASELISKVNAILQLLI